VDNSGYRTADRRLDSWKEIARYLQRDIRTVQLWEKKEGLPVHRHAHLVKASVYAYIAEIDAWQKNRRIQTEPEPIPAETVPAAGETLVAAWPPKSRLLPLVFSATVILLAIAALSVVAWRRHKQANQNMAEKVLAVLPFEDLSPQQLESYLADGLTDDLITTLGHSGQLQVISRTSANQFRRKHESLPSIASSLHANLVLDGTVAYTGKHARITAQLIDAASDQHLWANSYERDFDNVLALQDEIAAEIAAGVVEKLTGNPITVAASRPVDPEVRTSYLRGRFFWNKRDESGLKEAIRYFDEAIAKDPNYAPAYAGLADCYNLLSVWASLSPREAFPKAREMALKALQLDPMSAEAYNSLAFETYRYEWDFSAAERSFQEAITLNPNYATAHQWYGEFLGDLRRFNQSIAESQKAEQLDPLSTIVGSDLADSYMHAGRYQEAVSELQKILTMDPSFIPAHFYLTEAYRLAGENAKSEEEKKKYVQLSGDRGAFLVEQITEEWAAGKRGEARRQMQALLRDPGKGRFDYFHMAQMYVSIGDRDKAFACLEEAYKEHSWWLVTLLVDPGLAPVRNDPRLRNLALRVGLPTTA
jgi:TolB-like protein/lipoprotein NlpI